MLKKVASTKVSLLTVIAIILAGAVAVAVYWINTEQISTEYNYNDTLILRQPGQSFVAEGNLIKDRLGMPKGVWHLEYQRKGQGNLVTRLLFTQNSVCRIAEQNKKCGEVKLQNGWRVLIVGRLNDSEVTVYKLEAI